MRSDISQISSQDAPEVLHPLLSAIVYAVACVVVVSSSSLFLLWKTPPRYIAALLYLFLAPFFTFSAFYLTFICLAFSFVKKAAEAAPPLTVWPTFMAPFFTDCLALAAFSEILCSSFFLPKKFLPFWRPLVRPTLSDPVFTADLPAVSILLPMFMTAYPVPIGEPCTSPVLQMTKPRSIWTFGCLYRNCSLHL